MHSLYTILGIPEGAPHIEVGRAFQRLREKLQPDQYEPNTLAHKQCRQSLSSVEDAYYTLTNPLRREQYERAWLNELPEVEEIHPKLGQLCVAAGVISLEELEIAVDTQHQVDLPIGQILQEKRLITQSELDGLLLGQQLISLPPDAPHTIGQRLIAMGLVTEDMVRIALIEQHTSSYRLGELLVGHGWVDKDVLAKLLNDPTTIAAATDSTAGCASR